MRSLALALALAAVLAGCVKTAPPATPASLVPADPIAPGTTGVLHSVGGKLADAASGTMALALGGAFHVGGDTPEPTLGVDKAGNVYVAGFQGAGGTVFKSADKGQTWKNVGPKLPTGGPDHTISFDPYLYVDVDTGRVFSDDIWPLGCGAVAWSDDQGATWTNNPASCGNPQVNDHQTLVTAKPHTLSTLMYPKILYRCVNNVGDSACAISLNGGLTFGPQVVAMHGVESGVGDSGATPVLCGGLTGHLAAAPDGTVYLPRGGCGYAEVAVSQDDGVTWAVHPIDPKAETDDHEVRVAVDEAGTAYATWNSKGKVVMSFSKDKGATWSQSIDVTAPGVTATWFTAIAAATPGRVAIAYIGSTVPGGYDGKTFEDCGFVGPPVEQCTPAKGWENATWNAYITILSDATSPSPVLQSATANDPNDPLARGECGRTRCHGMYDFIDLWIDQDGRPWASFNDVCTQKCVNDPATTHDKPVGLVATLLRGPALRGAARELPAILPQAVQGAT